MNYYKRHLGDYAKDTKTLNTYEHGVYTLLLDHYYTEESPFSMQDAEDLTRPGNEKERASLNKVLRKFFKQDGDLWRHSYADRVIKAAAEKAEKNRENGKGGGRPPSFKAAKVLRGPEANGNENKTHMVSGNIPPTSEMVDENNLSHKPLANAPTEDKKHLPSERDAREPVDPNVMAEFPSDWQPCATALAMVKQRGLQDPKPEHVAAFVGHWLGRSIEPRRIPGEFLKWMAKQRAFDARDGTGGNANGADTVPAWASFRAAIRDNRLPEDQRVRSIIQKFGGLHALGMRASFDLDRMRKDFDREFAAVTQ